jgi:polar amino acid transport system permease protein
MDIWSTLNETFLDWESMKAVLPEMLKVGLVNTLILAAASVVLGTVLGMIVAVFALSRKRWLRWPS